MNAIAIEQTRDELRARIHGGWVAAAPAWGEHAGFVDARAAAVTSRLLELTRPAPDSRCSRLACGPGGLGLAAAGLVGPDGGVVLSDAVPEMTAIAAARIARHGVANATTRVIDLDHILEPDDAYDVVLCREGLMFALEPERAAVAIGRVLRPGGRVAVAVWGPRAQNPWLAIVLEAVAAQFPEAVPPPGAPGPFALEDARRLTGLFNGAGLEDMIVEALPVPLEAPSFEDWWSRTTALAGPLSQLLAGLPEPARAALRERVAMAAEPYLGEDGAVLMPGTTLIAGGRKPR